MMGDGCMGKNSSQSRASSSGSMFNVDVKMLECWCLIICVERKANILKNPGRSFYAYPLPNVCLTIVI